MKLKKIGNYVEKYSTDRIVDAIKELKLKKC